MDTEFITQNEILMIRESIMDGVDAANSEGIVCEYPSDFTVTKSVNGTTVKATFPIRGRTSKTECVIPQPRPSRGKPKSGW